MSKTNAQLVWDFNKLFGRSQLAELEDIKRDTEQQKLKSQLALIEEEVEELKEAISDGDYEGMKDAVMDILVVTYGMAYVMKIDADKGLQEVNRSNLSKVCETEGELNDTLAYYDSLGVQCSILPTKLEGQSVFFVKSAKDQEDTNGKYYPKGKFLKNINWSEPDLSFVERVK